MKIAIMRKEDYYNFRDKWLEFISRIPKDIQENISKKILTDSIWGLRDSCIIYLYYFQKMSSYEIADKYKALFISKRENPLSSRRIREIVDKYNMGRGHDEALRLRVKTGRMDYDRRTKAPRYIDYTKRDKIHNYKYAIGLKRVLKLKNMSCDEFAKQIGLSYGAVRAWINLRARVSSNYQEKICDVLSASSSELFSETKPNTKPIKTIYYYAPKLKKILEKRKMPIVLLSRELHIPYSTLYQFKNKRNRAISKKFLVKLANYLNLKWRNLIISKLKVDTSKNFLWAVGLNSYLIKTGITKEELARRLGLNRITISRWAFLIQRVHPYFAAEIAKYFNAPMENIFKSDVKTRGVLRFTASKKEYYRDAKRVYDETNSLAETGRRLNISRERVRQILERGDKIGLFEYK